MDDRFRSEDAMSPQKGTAPVRPQITKSNLGDFSENIQSTRGRTASVTGGMSQPKPKKFQVHLPEEASLIPDIVPSVRKDETPVVKEITGKEYLDSVQRRNDSLQKTVKIDSNVSRGIQQNTRKPAVSRSTEVNSAAVKRTTSAGKPPVNKSGTQHKKTAQSAVSRKNKAASRKYNFVNSVLVACVCIIFISILTVTASTVAMTTINDILVIDRSGNDDYISVYIPPEVTEYEGVFDIVKDAGLIKQPLITDLFCKFRHYDEVDRYNKETKQYENVRIKYSPGTYFLNAEMGIESILEEIMVSSSGYKDTVRLTFPEGWTIAQIFEKLEKYNVCTAEKLYANLDIIGNEFDFISSIGTVNGRYLKAEGYLFPDTYDFFIGENAGSVIKKLLNNFDNKWKNEYNERLKELGMSVDQVITIASIIQREAKDTTQMDVVSSVIHNRLRDSATFPFINMDSTKAYVASLSEFNILSKFYYNMYLASYDTYMNQGLPPGPICNPSAAAIRAALYPEDTDYYYFCHNEQGEIFLAETKSQHDANYNKVLFGG